MSDLVSRLVGKTWYVTDSTGWRWADATPQDAAREILRLRAALQEIKDKGRTTGYSRMALVYIARDALEQNKPETRISGQADGGGGL